MHWGQEHEAAAVQQYETLTGSRTRRCGISVNAECCWLGASPDRVVGDDGFVEVEVEVFIKRWCCDGHVEEENVL